LKCHQEKKAATIRKQGKTLSNISRSSNYIWVASEEVKARVSPQAKKGTQPPETGAVLPT